MRGGKHRPSPDVELILRDRASALWAVHLIVNCGLSAADAIKYAMISGLAVFAPYVQNYSPGS